MTISSLPHAHPAESGTPTLSELAGAVAAWVESHEAELAPYRALEPTSVDEVVELDTGLQRLLYDAGWTRWGWPAAAGGLGGPATLRGVVYEGLWSHGVRQPEVFLTLETVGPAMVHYSPELSERFLMACVRGDERWCQGFSEPDAGSDLASLRTRAVADGDNFVVTGQKVWTSLGHLADRSAVLVRTGEAGHRGLSLMLVDLDSPGVIVRPVRAITGRAEFAESFFDEVVVSRDRLIGPLDGGWGVAMYLLQWERGMYAWERQAMLFTRLAEAVTTAGGRISDDTASRLGAAYRTLSALRTRSWHTLTRLAAGESPGPEVSVDKILLATAEQTALDVIRELTFPAFEMSSDQASTILRAEWFYSRAASIYGGAGEVQRSILAERVLGLPRA